MERYVTLWEKDTDDYSFVEHTLERNKIFNTNGLLEKNPSYQGRLKFWTNEMCAEKPQTFDIVLAVRPFTDPQTHPPTNGP